LTGRALPVFIASVISIYTTISLGALTRAMGAGMGCGPEWPLCLGYIVPPNLLVELEVFLEYTHRVSALIAFILVMLSSLIAWASNPYSRARSVRLWATLTLFVMIAQVLLGAIVVVLHLNPVASALHLMLATLSAITATIAAVEAYHYHR
jgi:heme A synthase